MRDIKVKLNPYVKYQYFTSHKGVFDNFVAYIKNNSMKLIFSILGQKFKLFGKRE